MDNLDNIVCFDKKKLKAVFVNGKYYIYDKVKYTNKEYENKYNYTKIYKITSPQTNRIYIGSTCKKYLSSRLSDHKFEYKRHIQTNAKNYCSSFEIVKFDDCKIELLELCNLETKEERYQKEREHIENNKDYIVNIYLK